MSKESLRRGGLPVSSQQDEVVDSLLKNPLTIVGAGAGSGKTHTTTAAVLELLTHRKANVDQLVLITYTNTASDNIRNRIEKEIHKQMNDPLSDKETRDFWRNQSERLSSAYIGTIHSFCRMVLATYGYDEKVARSSDMTYSVYQRKKVFNAILNQHILSQVQPQLIGLGNDYDYKDYELIDLLDQALEEVYNQGYDMEVVHAWTTGQPYDAGKKYRLAFADMLVNGHRLYKMQKLEKPALDAHDLLFYTNKLLENGEDGSQVIERLTQRYHYVFIDEFQDTNRLQLEIVKKLLPPGQDKPSMAGVLVVGDQKQSIFGFSGAYASLLNELAANRGVDILPMNVARRPTLNFLNLQNQVFEIVGQRLHELNDKLQSCEGTFDPDAKLPPLTFLTTPTAALLEEKIKVIADHIRQLLQQDFHLSSEKQSRLVEPGDIVILTRDKTQLNNYLIGLKEELDEVEFRSDRGEAFFHKPEIVATYRILRAIVHYPDDYILSQAVGGPYLTEVSATYIESYIINYGIKQGTPLTDHLSGSYPELFAQLGQLRRQVKKDTVPQFLENLYRTFNIRAYYQQDMEAILALERLREIARNLFSNDQALTLRTFVDYLEQNIRSGNTLKEATLEEEQSKRPDFIRLMTIHRSKGLEFPIIIIPDVDKEIIAEYYKPKFLVLPEHGIEVKIRGRNSCSNKYKELLESKKNDQFAEEMRVFYVAMTRAEQAVVLVGTEPSASSSRIADWNSWQDPLWFGQQELEQLGAVFHSRQVNQNPG